MRLNAKPANPRSGRERCDRHGPDRDILFHLGDDIFERHLCPLLRIQAIILYQHPQRGAAQHGAGKEADLFVELLPFAPFGLFGPTKRFVLSDPGFDEEFIKLKLDKPLIVTLPDA